MTSTQPLNNNNKHQKTNFVAQMKNLKIKFPSAAANVIKRFSFCASTSMVEKEEQRDPAVADLDSVTPEMASPQETVRRQQLKFTSEVCMIPHPSKRKKGGEDAYFMTENGLAIGVADGVGGWADKGVDPSLYSKTLMREAKHAYEDLYMNDPLQSLKHAAGKANKIMGSSTACILSIDKSISCLRSANLGDSGFLLIRDGEILYRTKEQQFHFNFPYQLGPTSRAQPKDADLASLELREGDKIVLGTDGLFDNLFDFEILQIVNKSATADCPLTPDASSPDFTKQGLLETDGQISQRLSVADQIARKASEKSRSSTHNTPFSQNAKANGMKVLGGKLDDITVLFATITSCGKENQVAQTNPPSEDSLLH